jgi:hypothetical protein
MDYKEKYPFYHLVPKEFYANLEFRRRMLRLSEQSLYYKQQLWLMCARDELFFINTFCWIYEPRPDEGKVGRILPFITYEFQDETISQVDEVMGKEDVGVEKSRDMGCTWIFLTMFFSRWLFFRLQSFLIYSRTQEAVDVPDNTDSLFWKLLFLLDNLPSFLQPMTHNKVLNQLKNGDNQSVINGTATTGDIARGGRRTATLGDEKAAFKIKDGYDAIASTTSVSNTNIRLSTPKGSQGAFYELMHNEEISMLKISLHWSRHPKKRKGLYRYTKDGLEILDKEYAFPDDYNFVMDGRLRSPWYDKERKRLLLDKLANQELDIDYIGSAFNFFSPSDIQRLISENARPPYLIGDIEYDHDTAEVKGFYETEHGRIKLWTNLDAYGHPPRDRNYSLGCDVSFGTGASNSTLSGVDKTTGEKILEFKSNVIDPTDFAKVSVAVARWLGGAFMKWETNGPGKIYGPKVLDLGYRNIYYKTDETKLGPRPSDRPGWSSTKDLKVSLLGRYRSGLNEGRFINRSESALKECLKFQFFPNGVVAHVASVDTEDPSGSSDSHGDIVISDALAFDTIEQQKDEEEEKEHIALPGSYMFRRKRFEQSLKEKTYWGS